jgi:ribosomal protein S18 acetylase RimI-like enzyme
MKIQYYQDSDLSNCVELFLKVFSGPPWYDKWPSSDHARGYIADLISMPGFIGVVTYEDNKLIGMAFGNVKKWYSGDEYFLNEFCICSDRQRMGIGTDILSFLKKELFKKNITAIVLLTARETSAAAFYEKNGFKFHQKIGFMVMHM